MSESQNTEWNESWRDDYIKWLCGFANALGGVLILGRNDKGQNVGINNAHELLEILPNKVRDLLGIIVDVNLAEIYLNMKQYSKALEYATLAGESAKKHNLVISFIPDRSDI